LGGPPAVVQGTSPQHGLLGINFPVDKNLEIISFLPGTPVATSNLKAGDTLTHVNDQPIANRAELLAALQRTKPGETVRLTYVRANEALTEDVRLIGFAEYVALTEAEKARRTSEESTAEERTNP
jgi:S1-C subfamily serine protease